MSKEDKTITEEAKVTFEDVAKVRLQFDRICDRLMEQCEVVEARDIKGEKQLALDLLYEVRQRYLHLWNCLNEIGEI